MVNYNWSILGTSYKDTAKGVHGCFNCEHGQVETRPKQEKKQKECKKQRHIQTLRLKEEGKQTMRAKDTRNGREEKDNKNKSEK